MSAMLQGYTYWRRILKYLHVPGYNDMELEEFYNELSETDLAGYLSSRDIAKVLQKSVEAVITKYCHSDTNVKGKFVSKTCKKVEDLPRPRKKPYDRNITREDIEVYSSFRPSVSTTISAEKMDQIMLSSGSESEGEGTVDIVETVEGHVQISNLELNCSASMSIFISVYFLFRQIEKGLEPDNVTPDSLSKVQVLSSLLVHPLSL